MFLNLVFFFFITFVSLCSFIGYGILTNDFLFKEKYNKNIFNYFFISLIFLIPFSIVYYLILGYYQIINLLIIFFGFYLYIKKIKFAETKILFSLTFIFFTALLISKSHEDFTVYHFQHIFELGDKSIKLGLANLDTRYFYASAYAYVQSLFNLPYFNYNLVNVPSYLILLSIIGYLYKEIQFERNIFINIFFLLLIIFKFKRFSEFGYDYISQFILIYLFLEFIYGNKVRNLISNIKLILIYFSSLLIKITNVYFIPILLLNFIYFRKKELKKFLNLKSLIFPITFLILSFTTNSFLKTGCFNYLIKETCLSKTKNIWVFNYEEIESSKKLSKNWSRGFYHQLKNNYSEQEYNKNFKWIENWFYGHFSIKIVPFILLSVFIFMITKIFIFKKDNYSRKNNEILIFTASSFSLIIWLINFAQYRFGFAVISIFTFMLLQIIFNINNKINKKIFFSFLLIGLTYFNSSNLFRISSEFKREDMYKYDNFPWFARPETLQKVESYKDFKYTRSFEGTTFWRTCFNAKLICVNHDQKVNINKNRRIIYIIKR